jgi:hypothetical protein
MSHGQDLVLLKNREVVVVSTFDIVMKRQKELEAVSDPEDIIEVINATPCGACGIDYADSMDAMCCPCHDDYQSRKL